VRIVFDDTAVAERLMDATDRSLQVELFVDVLKQLNHSVPDENFPAVFTLLDAEKSKPNRFRRFARDKRISFPEFTHHIKAELRDRRLVLIFSPYGYFVCLDKNGAKVLIGRNIIIKFFFGGAGKLFGKIFPHRQPVHILTCP